MREEHGVPLSTLTTMRVGGPAQRLVTVMSAVGRNLAVVVNQGVEKNKFGGSGESGKGAATSQAQEPKPGGAAVEAAAEPTSANPQVTD